MSVVVAMMLVEPGGHAYCLRRTCDVAIMYVLGTHILQSDCIYLDCVHIALNITGNELMGEWQKKLK